MELLYDNKPAGTLLLQMIYENGMKFVGNSDTKTFKVGSTLTKNSERLNSEHGSTS